MSDKQAQRLATLLRRDGLTLEGIASELNAYGYRTRRGKEFHKTTVLRLVQQRSVPGSDVELTIATIMHEIPVPLSGVISHPNSPENALTLAQ